MSQKASSTEAITFSLVHVPVKMYKATSDESAHFNMISPEGNKICQRIFDSVSDNEYTKKDCTDGYNIGKDASGNEEFILFSKEELRALDADSIGKGNISVDCFVPSETVDAIHIESTYYLKPDKGGDAAFRLLSESMVRNNKCIIGYWIYCGKEKLVQVRPYHGGLILHTLFYHNEVRDYDDNCANVDLSEIELQMADQLINDMSKPAFEPRNYNDAWTERVIDAVDRKRNGEAIVVNNNKPLPSLGLFEALKASLNKINTTK